MIECEISTGFYKGERVFLPRITLGPSKSSKFPFNFQRKQFPIKLSFAMTINKAQGQTLQRTGVYLPKPCFSHGQLYVALSRARSAQELKVLHHQTAVETTNNLVKNVVSFEVLQRAGIR
ncbi:ATP-dependent DNA helicase PIF1-like [Silene latifolia]|uniref:ATP-dependent DNA helicase PIF1-like n=1 Tax=Silene latifolia TaxID=37657 RepID=UPI003D778315